MSELEGFEELAKAFAQSARELPKQDLTKAVKKGAAIVQQTVRSTAPVRTGALKRALVLHRERSRSAGKVVFDLMFDPEDYFGFYRPILNPVRSKSDHAFYPASQEYGYFTRRPDGGMTYTKSNGETAKMDKVPGKYFMRSGAEISENAVTSTIVGELLLDIEKRLEG